jgi:hypothetical protein
MKGMDRGPYHDGNLFPRQFDRRSKAWYMKNNNDNTKNSKNTTTMQEQNDSRKKKLDE